MKKLLAIIYILTSLIALADSYNNPPIWHEYIKKAGNKINENWNPELFEINSTTIITYKVAKNGELISTKIIQSSGNEKADIYALNAIKASAPFEPLPKEYKGENVTIEFKFNYKFTNYYQINNEEITLSNEDYPKQYNNAYNTKTPEMKEYLQYISKKIKSNWYPTKTKTNKIYTVILTIKNDGTLIDCKTLETFNNIEADTRAKEAILNSIPFKPLPKEYLGEYISIKFMFDKKYQKNSQNISDYIDGMDLLFYLDHKKTTKH